MRTLLGFRPRVLLRPCRRVIILSGAIDPVDVSRSVKHVRHRCRLGELRRVLSQQRRSSVELAPVVSVEKLDSWLHDPATLSDLPLTPCNTLRPTELYVTNHGGLDLYNMAVKPFTTFAL